MFRLLALLVAILLATGVASAQGPAAKSPFGAPSASGEKGVAPRVAPEAAPPSGPMQQAWQWVLAKQAQVNRDLAGAVRGIKSADPIHATLTLAMLSFFYGVLHAAGPGHGKAVISSYVLADGRTVRRGILLAFLSALIQGVSALVLVSVLILLMRASGLQVRAMEAWLETASWALVTAVGAWLLYYQLRPVFAARAADGGKGGAPAQDHASHDHSHHHDHHHHAHGEGHHHHQHAHAGSCEVCAHLPGASELQGDWSWRRAFALAFAVGVRPCTGAILVLIFAIGQGLLWAGIFSTFAMALGTAITVSALAASAVGFRELAKRLAGGGASKWADRVQLAAGIGGAGLVLVLGAAFFVASLGAAKPF
jgi:nickel/cobalt transporter (NicO) family protein